MKYFTNTFNNCQNKTHDIQL